MADYPCDSHLARYNGPSARAYLNVYSEDQAVKFKASLCPDCLADWVTTWLERALHATPDGGWDPPMKDQELEGLWMPTGDTPQPLRGSKRF